MASSAFVMCVDPEPAYFGAGPMANVSSAGKATALKPIVVCTVVVPQNAFTSALAFLSESQVGDAVLEIKYTNKPFSSRVADDYISSLTKLDLNTLTVKLRTPFRETDAAIVLTSDPEYYGPSGPGDDDRIGVCAYGYPKSGEAWTTVSISYLGDNYRELCYSTSGLHFEN